MKLILIHILVIIGTFTSLPIKSQFRTDGKGKITGYEGEVPSCLVIPNEINNVTIHTIGNFSFYSKNIKSVKFPEGLKIIEPSAFARNEIKELVLPNGILEISDAAFYDNKLDNINIPTSVTKIGEGAFDCNLVTKINDKPSNGLIYARNEDCKIDKKIIVSYCGISKVIDFIPEGVTTIKGRVFSKNKIMFVRLPDSITEIGDWAFSNNLIKSINIPHNLKIIRTGVFSNNQLSCITIPKEVLIIYPNAFSKNNLVELTFEEGSKMQIIKEHAFSGNNTLEEVILPNKKKIHPQSEWGKGYMKISPEYSF